ncbi:hypothetical protein Cgig2_001082 [Carnegiea gigantea]|uniref:Uncharacterized protein n=1 Tax=Carnegiea gigantea TaxID=171969 RepID=A0A9Q1K6H0_9CARY|nr:hypothetical protein Cgig2_001082 [Carnegiea gigantea]
MVVSNATRAQSRRDKNPMVDVSEAHEVQDGSESSRATPHSVEKPPPKKEAYVAINALKNFMTTMIDALLQQVAERPWKQRVLWGHYLCLTMSPHGSVSPLHDGITLGCDVNVRSSAIIRARQALYKAQPDLALSITTYTPYATHSQCITCHTMWENTNGCTIAQYKKLKKALNELIDKGQIDRFLKRGQRAFRKDPTWPREEPQEVCTEIVATIAMGYAEGISHTM